MFLIRFCPILNQLFLDCCRYLVSSTSWNIGFWQFSPLFYRRILEALLHHFHFSKPLADIALSLAPNPKRQVVLLLSLPPFYKWEIWGTEVKPLAPGRHRQPGWASIRMQRLTLGLASPQSYCTPRIETLGVRIEMYGVRKADFKSQFCFCSIVWPCAPVAFSVPVSAYKM